MKILTTPFKFSAGKPAGVMLHSVDYYHRGTVGNYGKYGIFETIVIVNGKVEDLIALRANHFYPMHNNGDYDPHVLLSYMENKKDGWIYDLKATYPRCFKGGRHGVNVTHRGMRLK
jgi:hypothetical protein